MVPLNATTTAFSASEYPVKPKMSRASPRKVLTYHQIMAYRFKWELLANVALPGFDIGSLLIADGAGGGEFLGNRPIVVAESPHNE